MPRTRRLSLRSAVAVVLMAAIAGSAAAQRPLPDVLKPIRKEVEPKGDQWTKFNEQRTRFNEMRNGDVALSPPSAADKDALNAMAMYYVGRITHHELYVAPDGSQLRPKSPENSVGKLIENIHPNLLRANANPPLKPAQEAFVREFAVALDQTLTGILAECKTKDTAIVRVNAGIVLVEVCGTGAPAHWPTVTALLKDKNTPPEVFYYAIKAADALLAGYDPARTGWVRKDTHLALVQTLDDLITKGMSVANKVAPDDSPATAVLVTDPKAPPQPAALTPAQVRVIQHYRQMVVRALGRVRTDEVKSGDDVARPLVTLARVATGDPAIVPPPSDKETIEAVIGLMNAAPGPNLNLEVAADAVAVGLVRGFRAKSDSLKDASTHWKVLAAQVGDASTRWEAAAAKAKNPAAKGVVSALAKLTRDSVTTPLVQQKDDGAAPNFALNKVDDWVREHLPARATANDLYAEAPSKVAFPK